MLTHVMLVFVSAACKAKAGKVCGDACTTAVPGARTRLQIDRHIGWPVTSRGRGRRCWFFDVERHERLCSGGTPTRSHALRRARCERCLEKQAREACMSHCRARLATAGGEKCGREQQAAVVYPEGTCLTKAAQRRYTALLEGASLLLLFSLHPASCGWAMDPGQLGRVFARRLPTFC